MPEDLDTIANCESCGSPMDISAVAPFSNVVCPSCGHQARVKTKFGPYTLTHRYAVGGMSMVFSGKDSTLNREVAVKILSEEYSQDEKRIKAFEEEARITASFSHPNVVSVLRTGYAFGRYYIAMELVPGGHFEHHIRERKRIPEEDLLPIAIEVAQGLKAAKAAGLIHRDVKPGNILLDNDGHAKLVDFGLSLVTQGGTAKAEELWATPFYVPPETVEGKEEDFRSDIYALGATLYHALAGTPPCNEESMATDRLLKAKQEIIPLKDLAPEVSDATCDIVTQAMAYYPTERYSSYDDMIHALRKAEKGARQQKQLQSTQAHKLPRRSRSRKPLWVMVGAAVAAIVLIAFVIPQLRQGETEPDNNGNLNGNSGNQEAIARNFRNARNALKTGDYEQAANLFATLHANQSLQEPSRSWAGIESVLCHYLEGDSMMAREQARTTRDHLSDLSEDAASAIGAEIPALLIQLEDYPPLSTAESDQSPSHTVISGMLAGLKNWQQGMLDKAAENFRQVASTKLSANDQWVAPYQKLASDYLADHSILKGPLFSSMPIDARRCQRIFDDLEKLVNYDKLVKEAGQKLNWEEIRDTIKQKGLTMMLTKGRSYFNVRAWQLDLARRKKELEESQGN